MGKKTFDKVASDAIKILRGTNINEEDKITLVVLLTILQTIYEEDCK